VTGVQTCALPISLAGLRRYREMRVIEPFLRRGCILYMNALFRPENLVFWELFEKAEYRIFDWSDDFATFATSEFERQRDHEIVDRFLLKSDLVLGVNEALTARALSLNPRSFCLRNGTDFDRMSLADAEGTVRHKACASLRGPLIGYMGYMNFTRIDTEMMCEVASDRPEWQFVFIGPQVGETPLGLELPRLPNVHVLPAVSYAELPGVLKCFDVCIIPNRVNEHTDGNDPIKLFDYLASGRPIVATPTAGIETFSEVVSVASGAQEFSRAIELALADPSPQPAKDRRLQLARENSWQARADQLSDWICAYIHQQKGGSA